MSFIKNYSLHIVSGVLAAFTVLLPGEAANAVQGAAAFFLKRFDWLTLGVSSLAVVFCLVVALGPWGKLRLGGAFTKPDFSTLSWLAMLFAAGMGAGLVFWGAAEPLIFTVSPPPGGAPAQSPQAIQDAYALTMFHWALHAWAIYAVVALAVSYAAYGRGKTPLPSAPLAGLPRPLLRVVDWLALMAVIFGVVASIGQGSFQMSAGFERIMGIPGTDSVATQLAILVALTVVYLASSWGGLKRGIEPLSNFNVVIAILLVVFVLFAGPTLKLIGTMGSMLSAYLSQLIPLSLELRPEGAARDWTRDWSLTYFLWWVAWTPFVGVFIARISKGRSLREFMAGVVLLPSAVTLVWFATLGGAAIDIQLTDGVDLGVRDFATAPAATYVLLEQLPWAMITKIVAFILIFTFLVTSADSGAYVMAMFSSEEAQHPPRRERIFWGLVIALLTAGAILSEDGQAMTRALAVFGVVPLLLLMVAQAMAAGRDIWRDWRKEGKTS